MRNRRPRRDYAGIMNGTVSGRPAVRTSTSGQRRGVAMGAALAVVLLSGCTADSGDRPSWTAQPPASGSAASPTAPSTSAPSTTSGPAGGTKTPAATSSDGASRTAAAAGWKTYTDPARKVRFDLPEEWIAQSVSPDEGTLPGALKVEVKTADGAVMATLKTGLPATPAPDCPDPQRKPYIVLASEPVDLPSSGSAAIEPRVVFRVIQGYRYFGSYGVTNVVGGADGSACSLLNVVRGPAETGNYSFGDLDMLKAYAPDEKVAPAKTFDTLDQAGKYVSQGSEFANVKRMLMSLVINT